MKNLSAILISGFLFAGTAIADSPLWLRNPQFSPDGQKILFTYKGDIYTLPAAGGIAKQITSDKAYDSNPRWSPDGKNIVFTSLRDGWNDIYIVNSDGGTARKLTYHSGGKTPLAFINDSTLLISTFHQPDAKSVVAPFLPQIYKINVNAKMPRQLPYLSVAMKNASANSKGAILYSDKKGYEDIYRKHERSSGTSDIWLIDESGNFKKLTDFNGHDLEPVWAPGENSFYYLSEQSGTLNVHSRTIDGKDVKVTQFSGHPVRGLSADKNGNIVFSWDGELYTMQPGKTPVKLNVAITADDYDSDVVKGIRTSGASNIAVNEDGDEVAFVLRGDIYVTSTEFKTTRRITDTPGQERCLSFSPDGKTLVYDSERDGKWQLFTTTIEDKDATEFTYAKHLKEEPLYKCNTTAQQPVFSPDGKYVAFLENRTELKVINLKTKEVVTALDGKYNYSYADGDISFVWSPDSKWLLIDYIGIGGWNNTDIALVSRDGKTVVDLTESGYSDGNPRWALDGKAILYSTAKYGMKNHGSWGNQSDAMLMVLDGDAWDNFNMTEEEIKLKEKKEAKEEEKSDDTEKSKKKSDKKSNKGKNKKMDKEVISADSFDLANRLYRVKRLTDQSSFMGDYYLSQKGDKLYYVALSTEGEANLYVKDLKKGETKVLAEGVDGGIIPDKKGENLFVLSGKGISKVNLDSGEEKPVEFEALYDRKTSAERDYIFSHMVSQVKDKFYDVSLHGVDWDNYAEHYRKFLPHINNNYDFSILMSEILGELNASHTGASARVPGKGLATAELGAYFDDNYTGEGLKIVEILPRGPLSNKKSGIETGDIILSIDGNKIEKGKDYYHLLEGKVSRKTNLQIRKKNGEEKDVTIVPVSSSQISGLLYERWVERNEAIVDSLSKGRIGYVHVKGMDNPSFRTVYDRLLGRYRNREAVIVDTRFNGGGWLHNDIAILLNGKEYVRFTPRGQYIGSDPFSQWTKPSAMLVNESNYSDAHGTPYVYQTLGIGPVIGAPVPGTMTAVWWEEQIDPTLVFGIPQVTSLDRKGEPLENKQLNPDVLIYSTPDGLIGGRDAQLEGAVNHLLEKINKK